MMSGAEPPAPAPTYLGGRYQLIEQIGRGGTSVVWRAHDDLLDRDVAVKVLSATVDERFWPAIRAEARATGRLTNAHIAHMYDYGETAGTDDSASTPYLVMELVEGESLSGRLTAQGTLPWPEAALITAQIADALAAAHARGLVHRDVKPDNVILTDDGVKVIDFGISALAGSPDVEDDGQLVGTVAYLAPERLAGVPVGAAADMYALGVLLYRALAGALPWDEDTRTSLIRDHLFVPPAPLPQVDGMPPELAEICEACLDKQPQGRPSALEFAHRMAALATLRSGRFDPAPPRRPRVRRLLAASAVGAVLAVATGAWAWSSWPRAVAPHPAAAAVVPSPPPLACEATFSVNRDWGNGFTATVTVTNDSSADIADWQVSFAFGGDQRLAAPAGSTSTVVRQDGATVTASARTPGRVVHPHRSVTVPISARYTTSNPIPTVVSLNAHPCQTMVTGAAYRPPVTHRDDAPPVTVSAPSTGPNGGATPTPAPSGPPAPPPTPTPAPPPTPTPPPTSAPSPGGGGHHHGGGGPGSGSDGTQT